MTDRILTRADFEEKDGELYFDSDLVVDGNLDIDGNLGIVHFRFGVSATKSITISAGSAISAGKGISAGEGINTFRGDIMAQSVSCLRVAVGFNSTKEYVIAAKVQKGTVILGRVTTPQPMELYWHIHHGYLIERQSEPIEARIKYVKDNKPKEEIALRLRLLQRVKNQRLAAKLIHEKDQDGLNKLHVEECPDCPWDGTTIFPEARE